MQTQTLPIQVSGPSATPAPKSGNAGASADGAQFSQALSREMTQRQHSPAPAPAPAAKQAAPAKQPAAPAPASQGATPAAKPAGDKAAASTATADEDDSDAAAAAAAAAPVTADMLALVASFNPRVQKATAANAPATDPMAQPAASAPAVAADPAAAPAASFGAGGAQPDGAPHAGKQPAALPLDAAGSAAAVFRLATQGADAAVPAAGAEKTAAAALPAGAAQFAQAFAREGKAEPVALKDAPLPAAVIAPPVMAPIQQASLAVTHAAGAPTDAIAARVGTPGWDNQVSQKIVWMVAGKEQSASLTLNPPDMGPMQVVLSVNNDQATVTFTSAQPEVRQALENAMPKLREMLGETGIALGSATVNAGMPEQRQPSHGEQSRGASGATRVAGGAEVAIDPAQPLAARSAGGLGMVDTFA
jgi:flagellar hook-length control protein FliK